MIVKSKGSRKGRRALARLCRMQRQVRRLRDGQSHPGSKGWWKRTDGEYGEPIVRRGIVKRTSLQTFPLNEIIKVEQTSAHGIPL